MENYIFRNESFESYGLTKEKNWLEAPVCCDNKCHLCLPAETEELCDALSALLMEAEGKNSAMFLHKMDGTLFTMLKITNQESEVHFFTNQIADERHIPIFSLFAKEYDLDSYALLVQVKEEEWKVVEQ